MARLREFYLETVVPELMKQFGYKNINQAPRLSRIVLNMGLGEAIQNTKVLDTAVDELTAITGQKAVVTKARKSIANFKCPAKADVPLILETPKDTPEGTDWDAVNAAAGQQPGDSLLELGA